jgi:alpha-galactosidase
MEALTQFVRTWAQAARGESPIAPAPPLPAGPPLDFRYGGKPAAELLRVWTVSRDAPITLGDGVTESRTTWHDPATGLELRLELREFADFPAVEWVAHFHNRGAADTPIIEDIQALDLRWQAGPATRLCRGRGSQCRIDDFEYVTEELGKGATLNMATCGGRSSNTWLPFFNLDTGGTGVIVAIGWSGQWAARVAHAADGVISLRAGMEKTHLRLHPGEEIRTPRMLVLFWQGDRQESHNVLRRFILKHHTPRPGGKPLVAPSTVAHWGGMKSAEHLKRIEVYAWEKLDYDYYWIDAGWYGPSDSYSPDEFQGDWARHTGNWRVNPAAHPQGLLPIAEAVNKAGMKLLLWFEPERAIFGTPWTLEHPEWFLGDRTPLANLLLDIGNPQARRWLTDFLIDFITTNRIGGYRQDFNFDPLPYWQAKDTPERQGMAEIRHVEGLYAFWDELLERCPGLIIDNCASGGRRIDLETIGRSIPLWQSDFQCNWEADPVGGQTHGMGLGQWVPLHGTGVVGASRRAGDTYNFRSHVGPAVQFGVFPYESFPIQSDYPYDWHRRRLAEYYRMRPLYRGDYYPLTDQTPAPDAWAVSQFHRPDLGEGFLLALRRPGSPFTAARFRLQGLDLAADYEVEDADAGVKARMSGTQLCEEGLPVTMDTAPASWLAFYRRLSPQVTRT